MERIATTVGALHVQHHGSGPPLVCWPSLFCDVRTLRPLVDGLAVDHRLILVDGPGHGGSGGPTRPFTLEDCADAGMQVLDAAGIERAVWIGSAWGGHVGVMAALRHPDRLLGLVAMNAPMGAWTGRLRAMNAMVYWTLRALGRPRALVRKVAEEMIAPARRAEQPALLDPIVDCMLASSRGPFLAAVRSAMLDRPSLVPRLGGVRVPTLFVTGADDPLFPVAIARQQAAAIPGARFEVVPGSSHLSLWEVPDLVLPMLRKYLAEVESPEPAWPLAAGSTAGARGSRAGEGRTAPWPGPEHAAQPGSKPCEAAGRGISHLGRRGGDHRAELLDVEMPVGPEGGSQVTVEKDPLHAVRVEPCTDRESGDPIRAARGPPRGRAPPSGDTGLASSPARRPALARSGDGQPTR